MTAEEKDSLLKMAYLGMLMDLAWFGGKREGKKATIIETGEEFTFEELEKYCNDTKDIHGETP